MKRKTIWVCGACGRSGETRMTVGDESCYLKSVEVFEDTVQRGPDGLVKAATAVPNGGGNSGQHGNSTAGLIMTCKGLIDGTFIACGEGGNYCSSNCQNNGSCQR